MLKLKSGITVLKQKEGFPLFIQTQDKRYYTKGDGFWSVSRLVISLWETPTIVPVIYTNSFVSGKILEGSGLMVPGIVVPVILPAISYG